MADEKLLCWCGAEGTAEELFDLSGIKSCNCDGSGYKQCYCGGDQCVCHHHGEIECDGCENCDDESEQW